MNPDPVPPVRPLLTHVIADEPLRREAGITVGVELEDVDSGGSPAGTKLWCSSCNGDNVCPSSLEEQLLMRLLKAMG